MKQKKTKKKQMNQKDARFLQSIQGENLPILTLDPSWHALFVNGNKSSEVRRLERRLTDLLKQQGRLNNENRDMKGQKKRLMGRIFYNMSDMGEENDRRKAKQREMIEEINMRVVQNEDVLGLLPEQIKRVNEELLLETLKTVYQQVEVNRERIGQLDDSIERIRAELSARLLEKQNRENYNHEVFNSLKEIVGMKPVEIYEESRKKQ
ncbi:MAG: hypothetical protein PUC39_04820 [Lachnospiraceae bacterium]|nr:hypothetical protein [Lachnospiraceae bacterium]